MSDAPVLPDEMLTAYADGQLSADGMAMVDRLLVERPELGVRLQEILRVQAALRAAAPAAPVAPAALDAERRARLLMQASRPRLRLLPRLPRWAPYLAAACLVVAGIFITLASQMVTYSAPMVEEDIPPVRCAAVEPLGKDATLLRSMPSGAFAAAAPEGGGQVNATSGAIIAMVDLAEEKIAEREATETKGKGEVARLVERDGVMAGPMAGFHGIGDGVVGNRAKDVRASEVRRNANGPRQGGIAGPVPSPSVMPAKPMAPAAPAAAAPPAEPLPLDSDTSMSAKETGGKKRAASPGAVRSAAADKAEVAIPRGHEEAVADRKVQAIRQRNAAPVSIAQVGKAVASQQAKVAEVKDDLNEAKPAPRLRATPDLPVEDLGSLLAVNAQLAPGLPLADALAGLQDHAPGLPLRLAVDALPAAAQRGPVAAGEAPLGLQVVRAALAAGHQVRLNGGSLEVQPARAPLDPLDCGGLDPERFSAAFGAKPFVATRDDDRVTIAFSDDTASYQRALAQLRRGQAVDPGAIQPEHFVNAMPQGYPPAAGPEAFDLYAEAGPSPFAVGAAAARTALVAVGAVGRAPDAGERRPLRLTLAVDASGSMAQPGGLSRVRLALSEILPALDARDRIAVVAFGDAAAVALPATAGDRHERIAEALDRLVPSGSTNAGEGLALAYQLAGEMAAPGCESRVVLCTDGATLAGAAAAEAAERVARARGRGIALLVLGVGEARYESAALDELARRGDGQHLFLADDVQAQAVARARLLPAALQVLARDAKLQVRWNPDRVSHARLVGYERRRLAHADFRNDQADAAELAAGSRATALFEVVLAEGGVGPLGEAAVRYFDTRLGEVRELACPLAGGLVASQPSARLRLLACAAELGEALQRGWWANCRLPDLRRVAAEAQRAAAGDLARPAGEIRLMAEAAARQLPSVRKE